MPCSMCFPATASAILGFTSVDYTVIDLATVTLGAVSVPLQTSAPTTQLRPIVTETEPVVIASSIDYIDDAVELVLTGHTPGRLIVFDFRPEIDEHREAYDAARARLAEAGSPTVVETLSEVLERGRALPAASAAQRADDDIALLIYTSGSTGAPKGAIYTRSLAAKMWRPAAWGWADSPDAFITLNFMPMSHVMGRASLYGTLAHGGTAYFAAKSDLSTFLEDLALVRPTQLNFVPRVWEMLSSEVHSQLNRRLPEGADGATEAEIVADVRTHLLGDRYITVVTGSAPTSPELTQWVESFLDMHLVDGYGSTEAGGVLADGQVRRPPVIDYKLVDVPELGYFSTDRPHPRGELLLKTMNMFPGYYKRPEVTAEVFDADGFYRTGDIVVELEPDRLQYVDRRNFVLKLSQGEFVTASKLEAVFQNSPLVRQIYIYGNSARSYLLAVVVPVADAAAQGDTEELHRSIGDSLQDVAKAAGLQAFEIPRDFIIEPTPFTIGERSADRYPQAGTAEAQGALRPPAGAAVHGSGRRPGDRVARASPERRPASGRGDRQPRRGGAAGRGGLRGARRCTVHRSGRRLVVGVDIRQPATRDLRHRRARRRDRQPRQRPCRRLPNTSTPNGQAASGRRSPRYMAAEPPRSMPAI